MELDVATRELLKVFILPPGLLVLILLVGWLSCRRPFGRMLCLLGILSLYALSTPAVVGWLAAQLETIPALTPTQLQTSRADGIWVLMAGSTGFNPELGGGERLSPLSLERIDQALALHRKTGLPIVISGGSVRGDTRPLAELAAEWLQDRAGVKPLAIDNTSRDTWENARDSAAVLAKNGLNRVLLVTHAYHMPRAVLSARAAGIDVVPAPFAFKHVAPELRPPMDFHDWLPNHNAMQDSYFVLHEMVGLVWYGLLRNSI
ncbi:MAG: YdcF family protein [Chromatiaceae bacterium]|nr:YdcF family protein [Chromatiaceae bacterium]MCP5422355.1 YdcF family protein [Chromatiaceae bacterium]